MTYRVWYKRNPNFQPEMPRNLGQFLSDFAEVVELNYLTLDDVFRYMQGDVWSPNGEARAHIERLGLQHTSMSVGDIIEEVPFGIFHLVEAMGFKKFRFDLLNGELIAGRFGEQYHPKRVK